MGRDAPELAKAVTAMPRIGWVAVGAALGAFAATGDTLPAELRLPGVALVASVAIAVGMLSLLHRGLREERSPRFRPPIGLLGLGIGGAAIVVRLLVSPNPDGTGPLPTDRGPWDGTVVSVGSPRDSTQRAVLQLATWGFPLVAASLPRYPAVMPGDAVSITGSTRPPGDDEYGRYLVRSRIAGSLMARTLSVRAPPSGVGGLLEGLRRASDRGLSLVLPEPQAGLASGILIGLRERVDRQVADAFTAAGVTHVVAISGWNIAIVGAAVAAVLRRRSRRVRAMATLLAIVAYTAFAGASASVVRAAVMAGVVLLARESGRRGGAATALGWAVVVLLVADPRFVNDVGLQLSALATAGLIAWGTRLTSRLRAVGRGHLPDWLAECLGVSLAAQAATLPLILATFGRLSLISPVANLAVVPLVPPAMAAGAIALIAGWLAASGFPSGPIAALATVAALPAWLALTAMVRLVGIAANVPFASVTFDPGLTTGAGIIVALAIAAFASGRLRVGAVLPLVTAEGAATSPPHLARAKDRAHTGRDPRRGRNLRRPLLGLGLAIVVLVVAAATRPDGRAHVVVLDVGQADAILVEGSRGGRLLVDGAADPEHLLTALDGRMPPWDRRIDLVVVTHPHEDHLGGLAVLLERYRIGRVLGTGRHGTGPAATAFERTLAATGRRLEPLTIGATLSVDDVRLRALWPPVDRVLAAGDEGRTVNDSSIVLLGEASGRRFLLLGDAEDDVDPHLVAAGLPHVDLLKVAHHGSATATSDVLLAATRPTIAAISVGATNTYGHPSRRTLARVASVSRLVLRTDRDGTIDASFGAGGMSVTTVRGLAQARPASRAISEPTSGLYHPIDVRTRARRRRRAPAPSRPSRVVPASLARRRRDRGVARPACGDPRPCGRSRRRRGSRPAPRCRQARSGPGGGSASRVDATWRWLGAVAV